MAQEKEITMQGLSWAVGIRPEFFNYYEEVGQGIEEQIRQHNADVRQRRDAEIQTKIMQTVEVLEQSDCPVTLTATLEALGLTQGILSRNYPRLWAQLNTAVRVLRARCRAAQIAGYLARIDAAAAQLVAQGVRLTHEAIRNAAGLTIGHCQAPMLRAALRHWAGHFGPGN